MSGEEAFQWLATYVIFGIEGDPCKMWLRAQSDQGDYVRMDVYADLFSPVAWRKQTIAHEETQRGTAWTSLSQQARAQMLASFWAWWNALTQAQQAEWGNAQGLENMERSGGNAWMTGEGHDEDDTGTGEEAEEGNGVEEALAVTAVEVVGEEHEEEDEHPEAPSGSSIQHSLQAPPIKRVKLWAGVEGVANVEQILLMVQSQSNCYDNFDNACDTAYNAFEEQQAKFDGVEMSSVQTIKKVFGTARRVARAGKMVGKTVVLDHGAGTKVEHSWQAPPIDHRFPAPGVPKSAMQALHASEDGKKGGLRDILRNIFEGLKRADGAKVDKASKKKKRAGYKEYSKDENQEGRLCQKQGMRVNSAQVAPHHPP